MTSPSQLNKGKSQVFVVPETHWDRAWYLPFEQIRRKLVHFFDNLIQTLHDDPDFTCFVADGQTVVIEDYLQARPEMKQDIEGLGCRKKRLKIGPWYVLPGRIHCVGGISGAESGSRLPAGAVDGGGDAGWLRSRSFWSCWVKLPQILRGFGIDNFIFTRGVMVRRPTWSLPWRGPDGSSVLAIHQRNGYGNACMLGYPVWWGSPERMKFSMRAALEQIDNAVNGLADRSHTHVYLLNNGVDHASHQPELPRIIAEARKKWPKADIRISGIRRLHSGRKGCAEGEGADGQRS